MNKLEIKLKQHTPLIHFQYDQDGATLRASEVKPRLDKYILTHLGNDDYQSGIKIAKEKGWLVGKGEHPALDYKMRIEAQEVQNAALERNNELPMYFGNMNSDNPKGKSESMDNNLIDLFVFSTDELLIKEIEKQVTDFFLLNNFGTRQSKGYGSFSVKTIDDNSIDKVVPTKYVACFATIKNQCFKDIDLFYKTIRSGINQNGSYFKSLMYHYAKSNGIKEYWDKRAIRTHFELFSNSERRRELTDYYLTKKREWDKGEKKDFHVDCEKGCDTNNARLYRDMLGLSFSQSWNFYGATISKEENAETKEIERFKSPILVKPLYDEKAQKYIVYIISMPICDGIKDKEFKISIKYDDGRQANRNITPITIKTPSDFDVTKYLTYVFKGEGRNIAIRQINAMPDKILRKDKKSNKEIEIDNPIKKSLKRIYNIN